MLTEHKRAAAWATLCTTLWRWFLTNQRHQLLWSVIRLPTMHMCVMQAFGKGIGPFIENVTEPDFLQAVSCPGHANILLLAIAYSVLSAWLCDCDLGCTDCLDLLQLVTLLADHTQTTATLMPHCNDCSFTVCKRLSSSYY